LILSRERKYWSLSTRHHRSLTTRYGHRFTANHAGDLRRNWNIVRYEPIPSSWRRGVLLDLVDRLLGEILVDLGDDAGLDILVQRLAQVSGGAAISSALTWRSRTSFSSACATTRAKWCSSRSCQSVGSTALRLGPMLE
jgi:hypothetical protein